MPAPFETSAIQIGQMLRMGHTYEVPIFQRDYSWDEDNYSRFWDDLDGVMRNDASDYFLGAMVINDAHSPRLSIIDGQQRITTASLLLCALRDAATEYGNRDLALNIATDFLGRIDYGTGCRVPKLKLNRTNRAFYEERLFPGTTRADADRERQDSRNDESNRLLAASYLFFFNRICDSIERGASITKLAADIIGALDARLTIIFISVKDDQNAYLLFETLNDRGLGLSVADLLKNFLFARAGGNNLSIIQENWEEMTNNLGKFEVRTFLRHFWLSTEGVITESRLYRAFFEKYSTPSKVLDLSRILKDEAYIYGAFEDPEHEIWSQFGGDKKMIQKGLRDLRQFGITQSYPILLAVMADNISAFASTLRAVVVFAFRYSMILNKSSGTVEKAYSSAARFARGNPSASARDLFARLAYLYPSDDDFGRGFKVKEFRQAPMARYILREINDWMMREEGVQTIDDPNVLNLEHILPKAPSDEWISAFGGHRDVCLSYCHRLGNMTLMRSALNTAAKNQRWSAKRDLIARQPLKISEGALSEDVWDAAAIERRQQSMAKLAKEVWRVDF
jgi:hypothetical protein